MLIRITTTALVLASLAATGPAFARTDWTVPAPLGAEELARTCPMINIGTPSKPRLVKDPACSSGR
ncbi:hypothetical protein L1787_09435 [Acuticoccus sp. M5D2P5]|uniref:hypothetical protein n=1 Tax=Acuticoccus kalidii TaxID=2910977 RepID=UPI001F2A0CF4|nr:hypothetical protein [Acuticoccus kalidii]MCF3933633.1 hypothetical protein [Acuticoccus kalidii]